MANWAIFFVIIALNLNKIKKMKKNKKNMKNRFAFENKCDIMNL